MQSQGLTHVECQREMCPAQLDVRFFLRLYYLQSLARFTEMAGDILQEEELESSQALGQSSFHSS